ncbi:hypothetical protein CSUI_000510 [Cystoisospora suis]|uniref:Transmembrane protein n=1 Tax=Cystoisospora suis TaxID=483139 RepID=A0A2C6LGC6_9APIC|nr:hypothetical protein CSUI_000510 [Cystoisospora suis]
MKTEAFVKISAIALIVANLLLMVCLWEANNYAKGELTAVHSNSRQPSNHGYDNNSIGVQEDIEHTGPSHAGEDSGEADGQETIDRPSSPRRLVRRRSSSMPVTLPKLLLAVSLIGAAIYAFPRIARIFKRRYDGDKDTDALELADVVKTRAARIILVGFLTVLLASILVLALHPTLKLRQRTQEVPVAYEENSGEFKRVVIGLRFSPDSPWKPGKHPIDLSFGGVDFRLYLSEETEGVLESHGKFGELQKFLEESIPVLSQIEGKFYWEWGSREAEIESGYLFDVPADESTATYAFHIPDSLRQVFVKDENGESEAEADLQAVLKALAIEANKFNPVPTGTEIFMGDRDSAYTERGTHGFPDPQTKVENGKTVIVLGTGWQDFTRRDRVSKDASTAQFHKVDAYEFKDGHRSIDLQLEDGALLRMMIPRHAEEAWKDAGVVDLVKNILSEHPAKADPVHTGHPTHTMIWGTDSGVQVGPAYKHGGTLYRVLLPEAVTDAFTAYQMKMSAREKALGSLAHKDLPAPGQDMEAMLEAAVAEIHRHRVSRRARGRRF